MATTARNFMIDARKRKSFSQQELGELVGVSQAAIAAYEAGDRNPLREVAARIGAELSIDWRLFFPDFFPEIPSVDPPATPTNSIAS